MEAFEVNFDGLVGPTHHYGGLSYGNVASIHHQKQASNPREAALQGLEKMHLLMRLGLPQGILPPHERPHLPTLRTLGYYGSDLEVISKAVAETPEIYMATASAASMWTANAATITPSSDTLDHKVHFTPANLISKFHRSIEAPLTSRILKRIFSNPNFFIHHDPLPFSLNFADEGAANHTRFCTDYSQAGVHLFVYGRHSFKINRKAPHKFPVRQTAEAFEAIAKRHLISPENILFAQQNPEAIDAGVFHNDVISVGNQNVFFYHAKAFVNTNDVINTLKDLFEKKCHSQLHVIQVQENDIKLKDAVDTYIFNSQLITLPSQKMCLIAPIECQENISVSAFFKELIVSKRSPIEEVMYLDLRQSMNNGGGPACLRLRIVLNSEEIKATLPSVFLTEELYTILKNWIMRHYRDRIEVEDIKDPKLYEESKIALDELTQILNLGSIYSFQ